MAPPKRTCRLALAGLVMTGLVMTGTGPSAETVGTAPAPRKALVHKAPVILPAAQTTAPVQTSGRAPATIPKAALQRHEP
jgi:hypothetical protein